MSIFANADGFSVPDLIPNVVDKSGTLYQSQIDAINSTIVGLRTKANIYAAVLLVSNTGELSIESAAQQVFKTWKLGTAKENNGLLFIFSMQDHKSRLEVGRGLEGDLTDLQAGRILDNIVRPYFRRKQYAEGINQALTAVQAIRNGQPLRDAHSSSALPLIPPALAWLVLVWLFIPILRLVAYGLGSKRLGKFDFNQLIDHGGSKTERMTPSAWLCGGGTSVFIRVFVTINPGLFFIIFAMGGLPGWLPMLAAYAFIFYFQYRAFLHPAISAKAFHRRAARCRLSRIRARLKKSRLIFGQHYTYTPPSSSSGSSTDSSSGFSSSSGGGSSGGGGASSSW